MNCAIKVSMLLMLAACARVSAAPTEWTGANGSLWTDGGNWSGAAQPVNGDSLFFLVNPANQPSQNDLTNFAPDSLTFSNAAALSLGGNAFGLGYSTNVLAVSLGRSSFSASGTTVEAHGILAGQIVLISGAGAPFDGHVVVTVPNATQFTFTVSNSGVTNTSGSVVRAPMIVNQNVTAGRNVTLGNALAVTPTQHWNFVNANGVTIFGGDLSGGGTIFYSGVDVRTVLPPLRLAGTNAGFTGNFVPVITASSGLMLMHPAAMTAGNIDLGPNDRSLWLQGGAGIGTYTFGVGIGTNALNSRNGGQGGMKITGGNATWDPGNGGDFSIVGIGAPRIRLARALATDSNWLTIGNSASRVILSTGGFIIGCGDSGAGLFAARMDYALSDDGSARPFTVGEGGNSFGLLVSLTRQADAGANLGGKTVIDSGAVLALTNLNQVFNGSIELRNGTLLLDGLSWADFAANRSSGYGGGLLTWSLTNGGFAARGAPLVIPNDTSAGLSDSTFNKNINLGSAYLDPSSGGFYANQPVTLARDTIITTQRTISVAATGPGVVGTGGIVHAISANLSGTGVPFFTGGANASLNQVSEVVLSGTNTWTGSAANAINTGNFLNTGAGGLHIGAGYVVFENDAALPTGNGGNPAFLAAVARNTTSFGYGFLLRGGVTENIFDLAPNSRFMLGAMSTSQSSGLFGATPGRSKLQNSSILVHDGLDSFFTAGVGGLPMMILTRGNAVLTLGDSTNGAARIVPSRGQDASSTGVATPAITATNSRVLVKRGEGTLVLENVAYTDIAETGNTAAQFVWQLGRGTGGNNGNSAYFDGAVRGLSPNDPAASASNSLAGFWIALRGGVYEINNSGGGSGTFNRWLVTGAAPTNISIGNVSGTTGLGGGGFAAWGGDVVVDLNTNGSRETFTFGQSNSGFVQANDPLIFGSQTANAMIEMFDNLNLNGSSREFRVLDNTNAAGDRARISGTISGGSASLLNKTGAGLLELTGANTYSGGTLVAVGTLLVINTTGSGTGTGNVTVASGATLGGGGTIQGSVFSSGTVSPGSSPGLLTIQQDLSVLASSVLRIEIGGSAVAGTDYDNVAVGNNVNLGGALQVALVNSFVPSNGDTYVVLTAGSAVNGTFDTTNLPALGGGNGWDVAYLPNALVLSITNGGGGPPPSTGYDLFATQITNGLAAPNQDADADGYANLLEYVTGANPTNADDIARLTAARTNGVLALKFTRNTNSVDATIIVEGSYAVSNNAAWLGIAVNSNGVWTGASVSETGANPVNVTVQDTDPAATNRYLRLRVTRP